MHKRLDINVQQLDMDKLSSVEDILVCCGLCSRDSLSERLAWLAKHDQNLVLIAEVDNKAVGCLIATYNGFHAFLSHIAVVEGWQKCGVGRAMHDRLLAWVTGFNALGIIADSLLDSTPFFRRLGYRTPGAVFLIHDLHDHA